MTEAAMADPERNFGERREAAARTWRLAIYIALLVAGMAVGFLFGFYETNEGPYLAQGNIPGWLAIVLALVTFVALAGGSLLARRRMDEVECQNNRVAASWAAGVVLVAYPVWYILWKGRIVAEPSHEIMFIGLYAVVLFTYLFHKFRR